MNNKRQHADVPVNAQGGHILSLLLAQKLKEARLKVVNAPQECDDFHFGMLKGKVYGLAQALALVDVHYSRTLFANPVQAPKIAEELVLQHEKTIRALMMDNQRLRDGGAMEQGGTEVVQEALKDLIFNNTISSADKIAILQERCRNWNRQG